MAYLITQISLTLIAVALLAAAAGWFVGATLSRGRVGAADRRWRARLDEVERDRDQERRKREQQVAALSESRAALEDKEGAFLQLRARFEAGQRELEHTRVRFEGQEFEMERLKSQVSAALDAKSDTERALSERQRRLEVVAQQLQQSEARATELAGEGRRLRKRLGEIQQLSAVHEALREEHQRLRADYDALQASAGLPPAAPPRSRSVFRSTEKDDLTRIPGIGKLLERRLNELGLRTFEDLASLTTERAAEIATQLNGIDDPVRPEEWEAWIEQAKRLGGEA